METHGDVRAKCDASDHLACDCKAHRCRWCGSSYEVECGKCKSDLARKRNVPADVRPSAWGGVAEPKSTPWVSEENFPRFESTEEQEVQQEVVEEAIKSGTTIVEKVGEVNVNEVVSGKKEGEIGACDNQQEAKEKGLEHEMKVSKEVEETANDESKSEGTEEKRGSEARNGNVEEEASPDDASSVTSTTLSVSSVSQVTYSESGESFHTMVSEESEGQESEEVDRKGRGMALKRRRASRKPKKGGRTAKVDI
ncbi:uncharacterized protein LOC135385525 [Ornithodoros turicata]|uniref:uncharacterized protein LOC135385525 n=1 Tax=Ornithodoros turicata TaxID=34597 RepID=UPI00313932A9